VNQREIRRSPTTSTTPNRRRDFSYIILGAGCAGLSLAWHLIEAGVTEPILLLEGRSEYRNDRTWCYWSVEPTPFDDLADHTWHSWEVVATDEQRGFGASDSSPYLHLRSDRFYDRVLEKLKSSSTVSLKLGQKVVGYSEDRECVTIRTTEGEYTGRTVFDSTGIVTRRLLPPVEPDQSLSRERGNEQGRWLQHFSGQRIRVQRPVFIPDRLTLMDHRVTQKDGPHFIYLLPYSTTEALIENTYFFPAQITQSRHSLEIAEYLARFYNITPADFEVLGEERGAIPMEWRRPEVSSEGKIVPIGVAAGAARPATGYAFLRIQRQSREIAARIVAGRGPVSDPRSFGSRKYQLFDSIMLASLRRSPELAPDFFTTLFQRAESGSVIRFLTERSNLSDDLRVVRSVLKPQFIRMILRWLLDSRAISPSGESAESERLSGLTVDLRIQNRPADKKLGLDFHQSHL
jgi:lycopene beta-cyclase